MNRLRLIREYLNLGSLATVASVVGIAGGLYTLTGPHGSSGGNSSGGFPGAMGYVPQWQGGADNTWQQIMQDWGDFANQDAAALRPYLQHWLTNGHGTVDALVPRFHHYGDVMERTGDTFLGAQMDLERAGGRVFDTSMDSRGALHDRMLHDVVEGSREASTARGIGMSPEAANLESQATSNFNIDWQNEQLRRQLSGLSGLTGAYDAAGRQGQAGEAALAGAAEMHRGALALPFDLTNMYSGAMANGIYNPWNVLGGNLGQYMGLGQSGSQAAFNQWGNGFNNLMGGLGALSQQPWMQNFFSSPAASYGGQPWGGTPENPWYG